MSTMTITIVSAVCTSLLVFALSAAYKKLTKDNFAGYPEDCDLAKKLMKEFNVDSVQKLPKNLPELFRKD